MTHPALASLPTTSVISEGVNALRRPGDGAHCSGRIAAITSTSGLEYPNRSSRERCIWLANTATRSESASRSHTRWFHLREIYSCKAVARSATSTTWCVKKLGAQEHPMTYGTSYCSVRQEEDAAIRVTIRPQDDGLRPSGASPDLRRGQLCKKLDLSVERETLRHRVSDPPGKFRNRVSPSRSRNHLGESR